MNSYTFHINNTQDIEKNNHKKEEDRIIFKMNNLDDNIKDFTFNNVIFKGRNSLKFSDCIFKHCNFKDFNNCNFKNCVFIDSFHLKPIKNINFENCNFYLRNKEIKKISTCAYVKLYNCNFIGHGKGRSLKVNEVNELECIGCNFKKLNMVLSSYMSGIVFRNCKVTKCNYGFLLRNNSELEIYNTDFKNINKIIKNSFDSEFTYEDVPRLTIEQI